MSNCQDKETFDNAKLTLTEHINLLDACRMNYQCAEKKAVMTNKQFDTFGINESDVSMVQDASGGKGTVYHPHYSRYSPSEFPQSKDLLRVKCTFCKIHGHGTCIYVSYSQVESGGANLSLEIIYASLRKYLASKPNGHKIRCVVESKLGLELSNPALTLTMQFCWHIT